LWSQRLEREGILFFRAVDAAHFRGQFERFRDMPDRVAWRNQLFADLMDILKRNVYRKFGCSIVNSAFKDMDPKLAKEFSLNAYSLAGRTTEKHIRQWIASDWTRTTPISIVFESGDQGVGKLQKRLAEDGCFPPNFMPKKSTVGENGTQLGYIPLQAADWLAYETSIAIRLVESGEAHEVAQLRWPIQQFHRIPGETGVYAAANIQELEKNLDSIQTRKHATGV